MAEETKARIESELEVKAYIQDLKFALNNGAQIDFQAKRLVDEKRDEKYTNQYTVNKLFPDENPVDALKRELLTLSVEDYMQTVKDIRFPKRNGVSIREALIRRIILKNEKFKKVYLEKDKSGN